MTRSLSLRSSYCASLSRRKRLGQITASSFLALLLRYDMHVDAIPDEFLLPVRNFLPLNILLTLIIFYFFRLYHSLWAFAGENEM